MVIDLVIVLPRIPNLIKAVMLRAVVHNLWLCNAINRICTLQPDTSFEYPSSLCHVCMAQTEIIISEVRKYKIHIVIFWEYFNMLVPPYWAHLREKLQSIIEWAWKIPWLVVTRILNLVWSDSWTFSSSFSETYRNLKFISVRFIFGFASYAIFSFSEYLATLTLFSIQQKLRKFRSVVP